MAHGALVAFLGGSGPCIISFFDKKVQDGKAIAESIVSLDAENKMKCNTWITECGTGCKRI